MSYPHWMYVSTDPEKPTKKKTHQDKGLMGILFDEARKLREDMPPMPLKKDPDLRIRSWSEDSKNKFKVAKTFIRSTLQNWFSLRDEPTIVAVQTEFLRQCGVQSRVSHVDLMSLSRFRLLSAGDQKAIEQMARIWYEADFAVVMEFAAEEKRNKSRAITSHVPDIDGKCCRWLGIVAFEVVELVLLEAKIGASRRRRDVDDSGITIRLHPSRREAFLGLEVGSVF
uniref:Uncharacterized protein n=1 Tax=Lotharella globosa TaxID=91324 RepID=A0A6V3IPC1_9EUKA|mmetsp:Transcript_26610/g.51995  ORF Transcript_26610/g.51995 Transcript_26610/m.51995 type:complete len:226 (+) Transcript_26610:14-691(+)